MVDIFHCFPNSDTTTQAKANAKDFWVNMPNLISHLKKVAEQKPQATYYNVDMLKYQVGLAFGSTYIPQNYPNGSEPGSFTECFFFERLNEL